jgi:hypothetical protein
MFQGLSKGLERTILQRFLSRFEFDFLPTWRYLESEQQKLSMKTLNQFELAKTNAYDVFESHNSIVIVGLSALRVDLCERIHQF